MIAHLATAVLADPDSAACAGQGFICDLRGVLFDPAHITAEVIISVVFEAVQILLGAVVWKRVLKPRLMRDAHAEIDAAHHVQHHDDGHVRCCCHSGHHRCVETAASDARIEPTHAGTG